VSSTWESDASFCISKGRYNEAIGCLTKAVNSGDMPSNGIQTYFNRSVCYEKLGYFGPALQDAQTLYRIAEDANKLQLKHFRRLATCQINSNLFHDAKNTLIKSDLYESKIATTASYLSKSTLSNERIKIADLRRDLAAMMRKGTKNKKNPIFGSLSPAVASQLAPVALTSSMSLYSDIQGPPEKLDILEEDAATKEANEMKDLVKSMTIWDARASMKTVRRETKKVREEQQKIAIRREKSTRKVVHSFESLSRMSSKSSVGRAKEQVGKFKTSNSSSSLLSPQTANRSSPFSVMSNSGGSPGGSPSPDNGATGKQRKQRCPFPVATALTKGMYKKTEFPRYVRHHAQYQKKIKKRTHLRKTMQRLEQGQANRHEKYVFKDKMQLCKLVSVLGRDNTELSRYLEGEKKIDDDYFSESSDYSSDSSYDSSFDESDWDETRPNTTTSNRSRASRSMHLSRPGTVESNGSGSSSRPSTKFSMMGSNKSPAILALDAKMEEQMFENDDGRVKFPGLLS